MYPDPKFINKDKIQFRVPRKLGGASKGKVAGPNPARGADQIKNLYDFLYRLEFISVKYNITFNGKNLNDNEFSPGEMGTLLLIFYLLVDKSELPLIIDQPEENLDNESVVKLLVPYIKKAKEKRQIILVTHNPNLTVVCDAEQIIRSKMDKKTNQIRYTSGSLESENMNSNVVNVLEGTLQAFDNRGKKYWRDGDISQLFCEGC